MIVALVKFKKNPVKAVSSEQWKLDLISQSMFHLITDVSDHRKLEVQSNFQLVRSRSNFKQNLLFLTS